MYKSKDNNNTKKNNNNKLSNNPQIPTIKIK